MAENFEIVENYRGQQTIKVENPIIGMTMSVIPQEFDPIKSIEVAFFDRKGKFHGVFVFGPRELQIDTRDKDFWVEFGERYGNKFLSLTRFRESKIEKDVFPDLVEAREKAIRS